MYFIYYNNMATNITCRLLCVLSKLSFAILFPNPFGVGFGYEQSADAGSLSAPRARGVAMSRAARCRPCPVPSSSGPFLTPGKLKCHFSPTPPQPARCTPLPKLPG